MVRREILTVAAIRAHKGVLSCPGRRRNTGTEDVHDRGADRRRLRLARAGDRRGLTQKQHAVTRNFPVVGHFRYFFEGLGQPLRQYLFSSDLEERPYNRVTRSWVYAIERPTV